METRTAPLIGGRYRIEGLLGEGGMARVFDAFDERLERPAAVKILRTETRALPGMRERFQQEALIAARLIHPHIVAVLDFGEDRASSYLVMERLPGSTLRDEIIARGPLSPQRVLLVVSETLTALASAHARGVLHRDIKPSNILLQQDGHTKITDFGIAKSFDMRTDPSPATDDMTMTGVVLGTPGYLAPERRSARPATVQSDLYSVGAVMVEALTGQRLGPDPALTEQLPLPFRSVACRALAQDPRGRFSSADDMLRSLRSGVPGPRPVAAPPRRSEPLTTATLRQPPAAGTAILATSPAAHRADARARVRRRRLVLGGVAVAVLALALAAALFARHEYSGRSTGPPAPAATHHATRPRTQAVTRASAQQAPDAESTAITALATSLADGGLPGDGALASALQATAAQPPGPDREASANQALSLAGVLLDGGGITAGQYQNVVNVLQPTGATTTTTTAPDPAPQFQIPFFESHGHGHDHDAGPGDQG
ncbi:MAG: serine/threonine-protein kinase [Acidimicrobiales bacterium]